MDTEELFKQITRTYRYTDTSSARERRKTRILQFAREMVKHNDVPDSCRWCFFFLSGSCDLGLGKKEQPGCTVYDWIKILLENI